MFKAVHTIEDQLRIRFGLRLASECCQQCLDEYACYKDGHSKLKHVRSQMENALALGKYCLGTSHKNRLDTFLSIFLTRLTKLLVIVSLDSL